MRKEQEEALLTTSPAVAGYLMSWAFDHVKASARRDLTRSRFSFAILMRIRGREAGKLPVGHCVELFGPVRYDRPQPTLDTLLE
jgi:hypothetical protein